MKAWIIGLVGLGTSVFLQSLALADPACTAETRAELQKNLVGKWQFYSGGSRMCSGKIFRANGTFVEYQKGCAMKVLAPDQKDYGRWSLDAECKVQLVYNKAVENFAHERGRFATMTPKFQGHDRFSFKETFVGDDSYYKRQ